jgi:osmotically-inducible protein OsmY
LEGGVIRIAAQTDALRVYRPDPELAEAVRGALAAHRYLTSDDRRALNVDVVDQVAHLSGNVRTPQAKGYAHQAAASVPGVTAVVDTIAHDPQLEMDVGRALDAAGLFRYGAVYVRSSLGDVTLGGSVTAEAAIPDVVKAASAVTGVRSVASRVEVDASSPSATPRPEPAIARHDSPQT